MTKYELLHSAFVSAGSQLDCTCAAGGEVIAKCVSVFYYNNDFLLGRGDGRGG